MPAGGSHQSPASHTGPAIPPHRSPTFEADAITTDPSQATTPTATSLRSIGRSLAI